MSIEPPFPAPSATATIALGKSTPELPIIFMSSAFTSILPPSPELYCAF
jgi:hypothetical protein